MKTIAAVVATFMMMTASAGAGEPQNTETEEPIVLSESEMDEVTAAGYYAIFNNWDRGPSSSGDTNGGLSGFVRYTYDGLGSSVGTND